MRRTHLIDEELSRCVIGAFFDVYNTLGFGFLEHVYVVALEQELLARGRRVAREVQVRVTYKGCEIATQRIDMVVDERLVVEVKSTFSLHSSAARQAYSYLHATNLEIALLLHFGPVPDFRRLICKNARRDPPHPPNPPDPLPPSS